MAATFEMKQLEQQNERMKEGLVKYALGSAVLSFHFNMVDAVDLDMCLLFCVYVFQPFVVCQASK